MFWLHQHCILWLISKWTEVLQSLQIHTQIQIHWHSLSIAPYPGFSLRFIHPLKKHSPQLGCILQWAPQFDRFPLYFVCLSMFVLLLHLLPLSLHLLSSLNHAHLSYSDLINLYSAALSRNLPQCLPFFLWPLSSLSPQCSGVPLRKPLKVMSDSFELSPDRFFPQLFYTHLPIQRPILCGCVI